MTDRSLLVYVDLKGAPHAVGRLWARSRGGKESATFEYDAKWLANPRTKTSHSGALRSKFLCNGKRQSAKC